MKPFKKRIAFGVKIYAIAVSILLLLIFLSSFTYFKVQQVSNELEEISSYLIPLEELITRIDVHTIEQELHLERVWRLYEIKPVDTAHINKELALFEERGKLVDREVEEAEKLSARALEHLDTKIDIIEFSHIRSILEDIEREHQDFHDHALKIIELINEHKIDEARLLEEELEEEENNLDHELESILLEIEEFTEQTAIHTREHEEQVIKITLLLVVLSVLIGIGYAILVSFNLMRPINKLLQGTRELEKGNLDIHIPITTSDEIGEMTDFFNKMIMEVKAKEHIKTTFGQFLDPRIVDELIRQSSEAMEKGETREMTVFFSDLAGFSSISETLTASGLVNLINSYLTLASEPITRSKGVIDKFIGDAVAAFWGPPFTGEHNHAILACDAALEQFVQIDKLRKRLPDLMGIRKGLPEVNIRIGLATGPLVAGNIGSQELQSYTVMGDAVGFAETLEGANKKFGTSILISEATWKLAKDSFETRRIGKVTLQNGTKETVYELIARKGECEPDYLEFRNIFEEGLQHLGNKQYPAALEKFKACLKIKPEDRPAKLYIHEIEKKNQGGKK